MNWITEKRKINDLIPYDKNPRQMTEKQVNDLKASLEKFNFVEIPAINTDNTILAGHQRLKIMQLLGRGEEEVDVRVPDQPLTEAEVKEYNIRSNKNTGGWDFDILANSFEVEDLISWGFTDEELSIEFDKIKKAEENDFDPDEVRDVIGCNPQTRRGDIYQLGQHRLMCGDSTSPEDLDKLMGGGSSRHGIHRSAIQCRLPRRYARRWNAVHQKKDCQRQNECGGILQFPVQSDEKYDSNNRRSILCLHVEFRASQFMESVYRRRRSLANILYLGQARIYSF